MTGVTMPRFFFCLQDGQWELRDDEAQDFPGIVEAEQHARDVADELARNKSPSALRNCFIVVKDIDRAEVARVALGQQDWAQEKSASACRKAS
jgi:hypothetical protein